MELDDRQKYSITYTFQIQDKGDFDNELLLGVQKEQIIVSDFFLFCLLCHNKIVDNR